MHSGNPAEDASPRLPSAALPHPREFERLASICDLALCDRAVDPILDGIARRAADLCGAPFGLVTLVRERDQIFIGNSGIDGSSTDRDEAICAHTILEDEPLVVEDIQADPRFSELPITRQAPYLRFYAGAPIFDRSGLPLGSVCVLDTQPRELDSRRLFTLPRMAAMVAAVLEARRLAVDLLEARPHSGSVDAAFVRLDRILAPLIEAATPHRASLL